MEKRKKVSIIETGVLDGQMSFKHYLQDTVEDFDQMDFSSKEKAIKETREKYEQNMQKVGNEYGFDGRKLVIPYDNGIKYRTGEYFIADEKMYQKDKNLKKVKTPGDIVLLKKDNPGIAIGYPVSDDPVVIMEDQKKGITALAHCGLRQIGDRIPLHMINALREEAGSNLNDIKVYISSNLKQESNKVILKPKAIKNNPELWKGCIKKRFTFYQGQNTVQKIINLSIGLISSNIDQDQAIINMITNRGIPEENITVNKKNTYTETDLYSSAKSKMLHESVIDGKYLVGAYYEDSFPQYTAEKGRTRKL